MRGNKRLKEGADFVQIHTVIRDKEAIDALWRLTEGGKKNYSDVFGACLLIAQGLLRQRNGSSLFRLKEEVLGGNVILKEVIPKDDSETNTNQKNANGMSVTLNFSGNTEEFLKLLIQTVQTVPETLKNISPKEVEKIQKQEKEKILSEKQKGDLEEIFRKNGSRTSYVFKKIKLIELLVKNGEVERKKARHEMGLDQSGIFLLVKELEKEGLIVNKGEYRKKGHKIALTEKAREILGLIEI